MRSRLLAASVLSLAALAAAACKGSTALSPAPDIAGAWTFASNISNSVLEATCAGRASLNVAQSGNTVTETVTSGSNSCTVAGQGSLTSLTGTIYSGQASGSSLNFSDQSGCSYSGTMRGTPPDTIAGSTNCVLSLSGAGYTFPGTWQMTR